MTWWIFSLMGSIGLAAYFLLSQHAPLSPRQLALWRVFGVAGMFAPALFIFDLPQNPIFYLACITSGIGISFVDYQAFIGVKRFGSGTLSRLFPLAILMVFTTWFVVSSTYRADFLSLPDWRILGTIGVLCLSTLALFMAKKNKVSLAALKFILPICAMIVVIDISNKIAMTAAPPPHGVFLYQIFNSLAAGLILLTIFRRFPLVEEDKSTLSFKKQFLIALPLLAVFFFLSVGKQYGMALTSNPAYVSAMMSLSSVWIYGYNKVCRHPDESSLFWEFVFAGSIVGLILLS